MILRHIIEHVRYQNWAAIVLDFVIVVLGVFIGIQLGNWNEARHERSYQHGVLERLADDHEEMLIEIDDFIRIQQDIFRATSRMMELVESPDAPEQPDVIRADLATIFSGRPPPSRSATMMELISSANMRLISDENLRASLLEMDRSIAGASVTFDIFLNSWVAKEDSFINKVVFQDALNEDGTIIPPSVASYDLAGMREDPGILAHLSFRRRSAALLIDYLQARRAEVVSVLDLLEHQK